ncbi:TonB-dependent receptor [Formosa algae]|uniref:TonB-dependent receptor n=1 Tax=Formosa algae TaxID=225843 RepID=UPI000CCE23E1|nr:TonB-dependent receptor [Formosa algae]PNW30148.1 signal protein [Formosa algae]
MMKLLQLKLLMCLACIGISNVIVAQEVTGKVVDDTGSVPGVSVLVKGTAVGTTTNFEGEYSLKADIGATLVFSYVGYDTKEVVVSGSVVNVTMTAGVALDAVVLLGNRAKPRTLLDSPVPIDNIGVEELTGGGQPTIEAMLTFKVPSFNAQTQAIADATAHYDPADLRGLGPSRTLVLINGKRKNQSAQVYLNRTPGKGEVGVDLKSIPTAAIERVEILRDGASAQYGSDAIAGVINMVLKKDAQFSTFSAKSGLTTDGDGFNFATDFNTTLGFGEGGSINLTLGYYNQSHTNRAGVVDVDAEGATRDYEIEWLANNPKAGMTVGQPDLEKGDVFVNISHPVGESSEFYSFNGYTLRTGKSFAYYRAPYWRQDVADAQFLTPTEDFEGYQPTFEARIKDHINSMGLKMDLGNNWFADASVTYGRNSVSYTVNNSVNRDYLAEHGTSPTSFEPGGYSLSNIIGNLDFSSVFTEMISASFGLEYKIEYFEAVEGEPLSYYGAGSDSFAGIKPEEAGKWDRNNLGIYAGLDFDITESLLLGIAGRYEDFSDFGDNFSWKIFGRQKLGANGAIRASYSTGFRAPTLHQRFLTNSQYIIVAGSSEPLLQGTLANNNPAVEALGVPNLFAETSKNIAAGITYKFNSNFYASLDFYQINVDDRVLFSSQIGSDSDDTTTNPVEQILAENGVTAVQFFINAGDTKTTGLDIVLNYDNIDLGSAILNVNLAANFNETTIDAINTPDDLAANGYDIFERIEQGLITNSRPKSKIILGIDYIADKFNVGLYNTMFGEVTITSPLGEEFDQDLSSKVATDLSLSYHFTDKLSITGILNNIFDVYPDETLASTGTAEAASRFTYSSEVQQLGQLGTNFSIGFNYKF